MSGQLVTCYICNLSNERKNMIFQVNNIFCATKKCRKENIRRIEIAKKEEDKIPYTYTGSFGGGQAVY
jgi:hypothetical protein